MFGLHCSKKSKVGVEHKTILDSIKHAQLDLKINAVQIFTHGPANAKRTSMNYKEIREYCKENNIKLYVHGSYLSVGLWNIEKHARIIKHIIDMLICCIKLNSRGLVIHLPKKNVGVIVACFALLEKSILEHKYAEHLVKCRILLEAPAMGPSDETYETSQKLNKLVKALAKSTLKWGLCIDTAHMWSGGVDFGPAETWNKWLDELTDESRQKIKLFHLNGALEKNFGRGKDGHIIPLCKDDAIWKDYHPQGQKKNIIDSGFYSIVRFASENNIPIISEINIGDYGDVKLLMNTIIGILE